MSLSRFGTLARTGLMARRVPLAAVRLRAGHDFKFDFKDGTYINPIPEDEDLNPDWVYPDQDEFYLNGPVSPQRWMVVLGVMSAGAYLLAKVIMFFAPEAPAAPKDFEGELWEEMGGEPGQGPKTPEEIRNWRLRGLEGRRRFNDTDIMVNTWERA
eukprot:Phypoly_transcript_21609.p1 GENE.Phypoly_transcript_21609~~Phypoly_transcript_21609.p1  ORF type:complete len:156 (+),score=28.74 Phypoly_transcript_21609:71-538(+)